MAFLCGILAGLAANIRPLTAAAFLLPFLPAMFVQVFSRPRKRAAVLLLMGAGFLAMSALTLIYFKIITGDYFKSPITYYRPDFKLGPEMIFFSLGQAMRNLAHHHNVPDECVSVRISRQPHVPPLHRFVCEGDESRPDGARNSRIIRRTLSAVGISRRRGPGPGLLFRMHHPPGPSFQPGLSLLSRLREIAIPAPEPFSVESSSPQCRDRVLDVPPPSGSCIWADWPKPSNPRIRPSGRGTFTTPWCSFSSGPIKDGSSATGTIPRISMTMSFSAAPATPNPGPGWRRISRAGVLRSGLVWRSPEIRHPQGNEGRSRPYRFGRMPSKNKSLDPSLRILKFGA